MKTEETNSEINIDTTTKAVGFLGSCYIKCFLIVSFPMNNNDFWQKIDKNETKQTIQKYVLNIT